MSEQFSPSAPAPAPASGGDNKGLAIASLVLGILGFCTSLFPICGGLFGLVAVILGFLGLKSSGKGMAIAGIVLGGLGLLLAIIFIIIGAVSGPVLEQLQYQLNSGY